jgi:hypothetical protein
LSEEAIEKELRLTFFVAAEVFGYEVNKGLQTFGGGWHTVAVGKSTGGACLSLQTLAADPGIHPNFQQNLNPTEVRDPLQPFGFGLNPARRAVRNKIYIILPVAER